MKSVQILTALWDRVFSKKQGTVTPRVASLIDIARVDPETALTRLDSHTDGLTSEEAATRLEQYGPNQIAREQRRTVIRHIIERLINPLNVLLLALVIVNFFVLEDMESGSIVALMVVLSVTLSFVQEYRSSKAAEKLRAMVSTTETVLRREIIEDSEEPPKATRSEKPIRDLVPGDLILLSAGDMIPADVRILSARDLFLNQASLTGESLPVEKYATVNEAVITSDPLTLGNLCFMGSHVTSGTARAVVVQTGAHTYFGKLAKAIVAQRVTTSFEKGINRFTWLMIRFMLVMVPLVFLINWFTKGDWMEAFIFAMAVAVGLTPEMLPMIVTVNLSKGAMAMARKKVIVKRLNSIQNFGAMDVLCTDKTGTLTQDKVIMKRHVNLRGEDCDDVLHYAYLNSYYQSGLKNLLDVAVLEHVEVRQDLRIDQSYAKIDEIPFDFVRRRMSVVVAKEQSQHVLICKGAVEELLGICTHGEIEGIPATRPVVPRTPWTSDFPDVVLHTTLKDRDGHPCYAAAKAGDEQAAKKLAHDLLSDAALATLKTLGEGQHPLLVAVSALESAGFNAIPDAMAEDIGHRLGWDIDSSIVQTNEVRHTRADAMHRLVTHAFFDGTVQQGRSYVIVDDHVGLGGTIANLKGYIEDNGGKVIAATTLTESRECAKIALRPATRAALEEKHGQELQQFWRHVFGHDLACLTEPEAGNLLRGKDVNALRTGLAEAAEKARADGVQAVGLAGESERPLSGGRHTFPLDVAHRAAIADLAREMNEDGFRVVAVAHKDMPPEQTVYTVADECDLTLVGFIAFLDPPKESAAQAIAALESYGVRVKILTGDNDAVTRKICKEVNLKIDGLLLGNEVEALSDAELDKRVDQTNVFAKLSPAQKARVIASLHRNGHVVGFLGDGINDGPALKAADVGISVDTAVDIAKESADIILLEKNLLILEEGVIEGRKVFGNITKYIKMGASSNFGNMFSVLGASAWLPFLPMAPIQVLANNLLYDFSQTAIPTDNIDEDYLRKPRQWDIGNIARFMIVLGPISSIFDYATFFLMYYGFGAQTQGHAALFQTGWFVESLLTQTLIIHVIRTHKIPFLQSRASMPLIFTSLVISAIGLWLPTSPFASALGLKALPGLFWPALFAMLMAYLTLAHFVKLWFIKRYGWN